MDNNNNKKVKYSKGGKNKKDRNSNSDSNKKYFRRKDNRKKPLDGLLKVNKIDNPGEWVIEDLAKYKKAVLAAIDKVPETESKTLDFQEIWFNSSLPPDLILEIIKEDGLEKYDNIDKIVLNGECVWRRPITLKKILKGNENKSEENKPEEGRV